MNVLHLFYRLETPHPRFQAEWAALDRLGARYGRDAVALASQRGLSLQYLGAKIAFTRVPDPIEFDE